MLSVPISFETWSALFRWLSRVYKLYERKRLRKRRHYNVIGTRNSGSGKCNRRTGRCRLRILQVYRQVLLLRQKRGCHGRGGTEMACRQRDLCDGGKGSVLNAPRRFVPPYYGFCTVRIPESAAVSIRRLLLRYGLGPGSKFLPSIFWYFLYFLGSGDNNNYFLPLFIIPLTAG